MKKILLSTLCMLSALAAFAQQEIKSGDSLAFTKTDFSGNLAVKMIKADSARIEIKLNKVEINRLDWGVRDGTLVVKLKPGSTGTGSADVTLYYKELQSMKLSGANVTVQGTLAANVLNVDMSAGAVLGADLDTKDVFVKISGNSIATLSGKTKYYTLIAGTKSKVDSRTMASVDTRVDAASGAEVYVCASERLQMTADTGGAIFYKGDPEILRSTSKMMGTINSIGK